MARNRNVVLFLGLLAVAIVLRLHGLTREAIWLDEAVSIRSSQFTAADVLYANAHDSTPPLYFLGLLTWRRIVHDSDSLIRGYSVLWSLGGLLVAFAFACRAGGWGAGLLALVFAAVNPLDIYYAQEARMYAQAAALGFSSSCLLWLWLESRQAGKGAWWLWVGYTLCAAAVLLTHYVGVTLLIAQGLFALLILCMRKQQRAVLVYVGSALATSVIFLPWLWYVFHQQGGFNTGNFSWIRIPAAIDHVSFVWREFFWGAGTAGQRWWPLSLLAVLATGAAFFWSKWRMGRTRDGSAVPPDFALLSYLAWLVAGPVLIAAILSHLYRPIYFPPRFSSLLVLPFLVACSLAIRRFARRGLQAAFATLLCGIMVWGLWSQLHTSYKTDWRLLARAWREKGPPSMILFFPAYDYAPALYYINPPIPRIRRAELERQRREMQAAPSSLAGKEIWLCSRARYTFPIPGERSYYGWLRKQGSVTRIPLATKLVLESVRVPGNAESADQLDQVKVVQGNPRVSSATSLRGAGHTTSSPGSVGE